VDGLESGTWNKDALSIGALIGRNEQKAFGDLLKKIVGENAFDDFAVFKAHSDPETVGTRPSCEGFADESFGIREVADEVNALDLAKIDADDGPGSVKELEFALMDKVRRGNISGDCVAIQLANDDFLVS